MQLAQKTTTFKLAVFRFLNQKWLLWLFIVWLSFDISFKNNGVSVGFNKCLCAKTSSLFVAAKGK